MRSAESFQRSRGKGREEATQGIPDSEHSDSLNGLTGLQRQRNISRTIEHSLQSTPYARVLEEIANTVSSLGIHSGAIARTLAAGIVALGISTKEATAQSVDTIPTLTQEQINIVERVVAIPFPELRAKFKVEMPIPQSPTGSYIVHIGQMHRASLGDSLTNFLAQGEVVSTQQAIEDVLKRMLASQSLQCIFEEGIVDDSDGDSIKAFIKQGAEIGDRITSEPITNLREFERIKGMFDQYVAAARESPLVLHHLAKPLAAIKDRLLAVAEAESITFSEDPAEAAKQRDVLRDHAGKLRWDGYAKIFDETPSQYSMGATLKLFFEGRLAKICPTENKETNQRAMEALRNVKAIADEMKAEWDARYREIWQDTPDGRRIEEMHDLLRGKGFTKNDWAEYKRLSKAHGAVLGGLLVEMKDSIAPRFQPQLDAAQAEFERLADTPREIEVLKHITRYDALARAAQESLGHVVVVFGAGHDFAPELTQWNAENPQAYQRGLIKITPNVAVEAVAKTK